MKNNLKNDHINFHQENCVKYFSDQKLMYKVNFWFFLFVILFCHSLLSIGLSWYGFGRCLSRILTEKCASYCVKLRRTITAWCWQIALRAYYLGSNVHISTNTMVSSSNVFKPCNMSTKSEEWTGNQGYVAKFCMHGTVFSPCILCKVLSLY